MVGLALALGVPVVTTLGTRVFGGRVRGALVVGSAGFVLTSASTTTPGVGLVRRGLGVVGGGAHRGSSGLESQENLKEKSFRLFNFLSKPNN